jgi:hypothetical protein
MTAAAEIGGATARGHPVWAPLAPVLAAAVLVGTGGCGGPVRRAVAGRVTLDGRPLDEAVVMFMPLGEGGLKTGGPITAGRYAVPRDVGVLPGRYRVEIADDPPIEAAVPPEKRRSRPRRQVPPAYSAASPLTIEITADGPAEFDFELTSKPTSSRTP